MAENKMKQVAELLGIEMYNYFYVNKNKGHNPCIITEKGMFDCRGNTRSYLLSKLLLGEIEIEPQILDEKEKRYLERVLRPFKDKVRYISKESTTIGTHFINVSIYNDFDMSFPNFEEDTMYKGMEIDRKYTLEELGLFQDA